MKTVVLDPGHGGNGHLTGYGATGNGLREKELNLLVARWCRAKLKAYDCSVVMTRDADVDLSWTARANVARHNNADLLLSFHFNGYHDQRANGFESFIYSGSLSGETAAYQHAIHNKIYSILEPAGIRDRGKKRANFAILRLPPTSCVLPEYGFITNPEDAKVIKQPGMLQRLGEYTALGIVEALGLTKKQSEKPVELPKIQRTIAVKVDGIDTNVTGYLINNRTYLPMLEVGRIAGVEVTGHGDFINIKR